MSEKQIDRPTDRLIDRQTERLFSVGIKTKVVQNVNRMSKSQSDRQTNRKIDRARQNDRIAGQLKSPLLFIYTLIIKSNIMGWYQFPENYFPDSFPRKFLG